MPHESADEIGAGAPFLTRAWWLHPLLLAAFPVIFLFATNIREQITLEPLQFPLAMAVAGAAAVIAISAGLSRLVGRSAARGGLVASLLVAMFFSYGHVWQVAEEVLHLHRFLLIAYAAIAVCTVVVVLRARDTHVRAATGALNFAGMVLVGLNLVPIVQFQLADPRSSEAPSAQSTSTPTGVDQGPRRDVWYLVFDRYAGQDALSTIYGHDNQGFLDELEVRGFQVAEHSTANYLKTALSLRSTLTMDYLDADALLAAATTPDDWTPLYRALQGSNAVEQFLHGLGYSYVHLGVRRGATYTNTEADRVLLYDDHTEFSAVLRETTLLVALENVLGGDSPGGYAGLYGNHSLYQFNSLELLARASSETPRFIFAHFLLPHPPYAFNADGSWVTPEQAAARDEPEEYIQQLEFTNARVLELLDTLLARPTEESPIVLIQSDEGPFPTRYARDEEGFAWAEATDEELLQKFSILAAYRVPEVEPADLELYPGITPVNSFRVIFNAAFGTDLPLLPDRNLAFVDQRHVYEMIDVTDRLAALR
ncbi:MAG: hypothetical protein ACRDG7_07465 [Candidatus Limnocylindria bacterium]